jgi:hypothetical protein
MLAVGYIPRLGQNGYQFKDWLASLDEPHASRKKLARSYPKKDPAAGLTHFNVDKDVPHMHDIHRRVDATDADLSRFRSCGSKIVILRLGRSGSESADAVAITKGSGS